MPASVKPIEPTGIPVMTNEAADPLRTDESPSMQTGACSHRASNLTEGKGQSRSISDRIGLAILLAGLLFATFHLWARVPKEEKKPQMPLQRF